MDTSFSAEEHFRRGCAALECNNHEVALEHFRAAQRVDPNSPRYRSYYGLCLGIASRRFDQALELCRTAAREEFYNPEMYRNLAQVHLAFGFKAEGIRYLRRGLMIDPANEPILGDLKQLGVRRRPPLGFLPRRHVINRWIGMLLGPPARSAGRPRAGRLRAGFSRSRVDFPRMNEYPSPPRREVHPWVV
jgi:tetratricopeptide (TPR) repeat protein